MSWLGGSFSSITDQISNLTKDILTEGTEEVSDPVTELKLAQVRIRDLEGLLSSQKSENERVKVLIREAEERAEASELQVNTISSQYRNLLHQKQEEIKELKQKHHEMLESQISARPAGESDPHSHMTYHSTFSGAGSVTAAGGSEAFPGDEHDFGDSISMQHDINRLSKEVQRLQSECHHWKRMASETGGVKADIVQKDDSFDVTRLQTELKSLQHEASSLREQHQQEVVALQDHHRSQLATLKQRHQVELDQANDEAEVLRQQIASDSSSGNSTGLEVEVSNLQQRIQGLFDENGLLRSQLHTQQTEKDTATALLSQNETQSLQLKSRNCDLEKMVSSLEQEVTGLKSERSHLLENISRLEESARRQITELAATEENPACVSEDNEQVRAELFEAKQTLLDHLDLNHAHVLEVLADLQHVRHDINNEAMVRKTKLLSDKEKLVGELIAAGQKKSELSQEVIVTEKAQRELISATGDIVQSLGSSTNQHTFTDTQERDYAVLRDKTLEQEEKITLLEQTVATLTQQKLAVEEKIEDLQKKGETESQWDLSMNSRPVASTPCMKGRAGAEGDREDQGRELRHVTSQLRVYQEQAEEYECMKADWQLEKEALEDVLMGLRKQLREKEAALTSVQGSEKADDSGKQAVQDKVKALEKELQGLQEKNRELMSTVDQSKGAVSEQEELRRLLSEKSSEVLDLTTNKAELEAGLEELDLQHTEAMAEVIHIRDGLVQQADSLRLQLGERDAQIDRLTAELTEMRAASLTSESLQHSADQSQELSEVSLELERMRRQYERVRKEKTDQGQKVNSLSEQLAEGTQALTELHMDKQELEEKVKLQEDEVQETRDKLIEVKTQCQAAQKAYTDSMEKLALAEQRMQALEESSVFESSEQENLETEVESLKYQLNESVKESETCQSRITDLQAELNQSKEEVVSLKKGCADLEERLRHAQEQVSVTGTPASELTEVTALRSENQALYTQVEALRAEKEELEKELGQTEQKLQKQHKNYENYIHELEKSQALDASSLQEEHNKSMQVSHEKDMQIAQLEEEIVSLRGDLEDSKETVQSAIESQQQLSGLVSEKETDILNLKRENLHLSEKIEDQEKTVTDLESKVGVLEGTQVQLSRSREENQKLKDELSTIKLTNEDSSVDSDKMEARTLDVMTDMESELTLARLKVKESEDEVTRLTQVLKDQEISIRDLNEKTHLQGKELQVYADKVSKQDGVIAVLQQSKVQKESEMVKVKQRLDRAISLIESDKRHMLEQPDGVLSPTTAANLPAIEYPEKGTLDLDETEQRGSTSGKKADMDSKREDYTKVNGQLSEDWSDGSNDSVTAEIEQLQSLIKDKDQVIAELQNSNSSFLKMLESKSLTSNSEKTVVDVHKLENEVRSLKTEREQILAVMNEKSRESSKLKSEVHRLMNIISAEKTALDKLTQDNNHLIRKRENSPNEDMQKEAVQNLSRIIRDKDLEIEALTQKNETLLQVLQDSSQDGAQINGLIVDKENLSKQLAVIQNERDQMVAFVNQKHQESVAYHNEVQRLTAYINTENEKFENMQRDYANLVPEFEDKKQALLKVQNELINYKQKYTELEVKHGELVQRSNVTDTVDASTYNMKAQEASKLQERLKQCQQTLQSKEGKINSLNQRISELELSANGLESEKNTYKKQVEHLSFQMQSLRREVEVVRQDSVEAEEGKVQHSSELQTLRETNDNVMLSVREKEFELNMLKEKCNTLTAMLQEKEGRQGQLDRLLHDNELASHQARTFQQEKDQLMVVLRQRQSESDQLKAQVEKQRHKEQKLNGELDRLRNHLLQIEEGYTQEALAAEEREKELRTRLAGVEEKLLSSSAAVENVNLHAGQQLESLQQQLVAIAGQRDAAYSQVVLLQEQCQQYNASLANLQLVLEQFQQDRESTLATETDRYRSQIAELTGEVARLRSELAETQAKLDEASDGLEAAARLSEQLDKKQSTIEALRDEVQLREQALQSSEDEKKQLATTSEAKVDKVLVKNLLVGYLSTPQQKRNEALRVIGVVLNFSQEDFHKAVGDPGGSWIPGFLRFGRSPTTPPHSPTRLVTRGLDKSFSELFVKFLEKESSPPPPVMQLPAEQMAQETRQKHKEKEEQAAARNPQFNPFTAPRHAVMPVQVGGRSSPHDSHLLMATSLSSTLPMVSPLSTQEGASAPSPGAAGQLTLTTSSAILKDVLGAR